jgi:hypothetical protein
MKKIILTSLLVLILFTSGCWKQQEIDPTKPIDQKTKQDLENAAAKIDKSTKIIDEKTKSITEESNNIQSETVEVKSKVSEENKAAVTPHLDNINQSSKTIIAETQAITMANVDLKTAKELIHTAENKVVATDKVLEVLVKERDAALKQAKEAKEAKDSALHNMLQWLIIGCIAGAGVFVVVFFMTGSKGGIMGAAACGVVLIIAIAIESFFLYFAIAGAVLLLGMVGLLIYNVWTQRKAFSEVVDTVEITKDNLTPEVKNKIFGVADDKGLMKRIQSPMTMKMVERTKKGIPNLWMYAKEHKKGNLNGGHA